MSLPSWRRAQIAERNAELDARREAQVGTVLGFDPDADPQSIYDAQQALVRAWVAPGGRIVCHGCEPISLRIPFTVPATQRCDACGRPCGSSN